MLLIGSRALKKYLPTLVPNDFDFMITPEELEEVLKEHSVDDMNFTMYKQTDTYCCYEFDDHMYEYYVAKDNNSTAQILEYCNGKEASLEVLYMIKLSHRYLRNSPHFIKTRSHIRDIEKMGVVLQDPELQRILKLREKETYDYSHPVLNQSKDSFFQDEVGYIYDHDTIHEAVAVNGAPAYKSYMKDGEEVMVDKAKFFAAPEEIKLLGVYEETCVLALERCLIPFNFETTPKKAFIMALIKVCTSITSGWFREYAYKEFYNIIKMYRDLGEDDYVKRFHANQHMIKPFKKEE